jgi:soluble lytic murein transglycosylase-like protein
LKKHFYLLILTSLLLLSCNYAPTTVAYEETLIGDTTFRQPIEQDNYYIPEIPLSKELQKYLYDTCKEYDVDYAEAQAIMSVENPTYNFEAISDTNDYGLFQINICNHESLREILKINDFLEPHQNILAGVYKLSKLQSLDTQQRYIAYNQGVRGMKITVSRGYNSTLYSRKVYEEYLRIKKLCEGE